MNIDNLKPAWEQFKLNRADEISRDEVLSIIEDGHTKVAIFAPRRLMRYTAIYSFLILFCQGC
jgi:hypothetical protein